MYQYMNYKYYYTLSVTVHAHVYTFMIHNVSAAVPSRLCHFQYVMKGHLANQTTVVSFKN